MLTNIEKYFKNLTNIDKVEKCFLLVILPKVYLFIYLSMNSANDGVFKRASLCAIKD